MGQYHSIINLDKRAGYTPKSIGAFRKALEHGLSATPCAALLLALSDHKGWGGERIAIIGDYATDSDLTNSPFPASELHRRIEESDGIKNVGWMIRKVLESAGVVNFQSRKITTQYLNQPSTTQTLYQPTWLNPTAPADAPAVAVYNHDKKEAITPALLGDPGQLIEIIQYALRTAGGTGTALTALLLASCKGGGRGGGDFFSGHPLIGSWAGDHISVSPISEAGEGYTDITATLREELLAPELEDMGVEYTVSDSGAVSRIEK